MAIYKDDWGVKRVEKELESLHRAEARKWRGYSFADMLKWISRTGTGWSLEIDTKMKQLERAKENWRLWTTDPNYEIAIPDMVNGLAQVGLFPRRK